MKTNDKPFLKFIAALALLIYTAAAGVYAVICMALVCTPLIWLEVFNALWAMLSAYAFYTFLPGQLRGSRLVPPLAVLLTGSICFFILLSLFKITPGYAGLAMLGAAAFISVFYVRRQNLSRKVSKSKRKTPDNADILYSLMPEGSALYKDVFLPDTHIDPEYPKKADYVVTKGLGVYALFLADGSGRGPYTNKTAEAAKVFTLALQAYLIPTVPDVNVITAAIKIAGNVTDEPGLMPIQDTGLLMKGSAGTADQAQAEALHKWLASASSHYKMK